MDAYARDHFERLRMAALRDGTLGGIAAWITDNTYIKGMPFSFEDHEYQSVILKDDSREKFVRKCSQIGLSELSVRIALALCASLESFTTIYTLPTASFAKTFVRTRVDPVVDDSPKLQRAVDKSIDNSEIKRINNSFLYVKGTIGTKAAISVPADAIISDEVDFSDLETLSNYQSRLTHSKWKLKYKFSTPTVNKYGISADFDKSRRHWNFVKCNFCAHWFLPDYFNHVVLPGYDGDLRHINADNIHRYDYRSAHIVCPHCGATPSLQTEHRQWVVENDSEQRDAAGFQIQPFDAPNIITPGDLILSSTKYKRYADFINFSLGLPAEDKDSSFAEDELRSCFLSGVTPGFYSHVMGIDVGLLSHVMVAGVSPDGAMLTVHTAIVPVDRLQEHVRRLKVQFHVGVTVMDTQPYVETVVRMQESDSDLFGAIYVEMKGTEPFTLQMRDEEPEEGKLSVRLVKVNRNKCFDAFMGFLRDKKWHILEDENKETIISHMTDMKRIREFDSVEELRYVWRKSERGQDHFHHSAVYTWVAAKLRGLAGNRVLLPSLVDSFKVKIGV